MEGNDESIPDPEPELESNPELDAESELESDPENDPEPMVYANAISGIVWIDKNKDRVMDGDEPRAKGYRVLLLTEQYNLDSAVMSVDTDDNGEYRFENMEPGKTDENGYAYINCTNTTTVTVVQRISPNGDNACACLSTVFAPQFGAGIQTTDAKLSSASIKKMQADMRNRSAASNTYGAWKP